MAIAPAIAIAMKNWAAKGRLYVVNIIRDNYLSGQVLKRRTGTLVRSVGSEASNDDTSFTVGTSVTYGVGWELGFTRPAYTVTAKNAKALKIPTAGGFIFRKSANIPSKNFLSRPFIRPGLEFSYPYLTDTGEKEFAKAISDSFPDRVIRITRGG